MLPRGKLALMWERQLPHLVFLVVALWLLHLSTRLPAVTAGQLWGLSTRTWFLAAVVTPVLHQLWVVLWWRTELHLGLVSRRFGRLGFHLYATGFALLGIARTVLVYLLAVSNQGTFDVQPVMLKVLAVVIAVPALYLFYSVRRYFGFRRALGIDHFDRSYRNRPFVRQGIFRFTSNGMYTYGFLILWVPGLWWASSAALLAAIFNHAYIWVHYACTELPDIRRIYGPGDDYGIY